MPNTKALREKRYNLGKQAEEILTVAADEGRSLNADEEKKFDDIHADIDNLKKTIDRAEKQDELSKELATVPSLGKEDTDDDGKVVDAETRSKAMQAWCLMTTDQGPSDEQREAARRCGLNLSTKTLDLSLNRFSPKTMEEARAQSIGTDSAGGYTGPTGFVSEIETALLAYGGMRQVATVLRTADGNDLPFITVDDTSNTGSILGENSAVSNQDVTFGQTTLNAFKWTSDQVLVSVELMQDNAVNLPQYLGGLLGERIGRSVNTYMTTGTGSSQPNGIVTAAADSGISAGSATAVTYAELVDLEHSVDPAYRGKAVFMMNDSTVKALKKLVDGDSRPLWNAGMTVG